MINGNSLLFINKLIIFNLSLLSLPECMDSILFILFSSRGSDFVGLQGDQGNLCPNQLLP